MTSPSPAFIEALREERQAVLATLRLRPSADVFGDALGRLADLEDLESRVLEPPAVVV